MPSIFLSPSTQEKNPYVIGGTEEQYMNLVADAMEPYLRASGIRFTRNNPEESVSPGLSGSPMPASMICISRSIPMRRGRQTPDQVRGTDLYYYPGSAAGQRAADVLAENFRRIYPLPDRVRTLPTTSLAEVARTRAPAVLMEIAYHDNPEDAAFTATISPPLPATLCRG